MATRQVVTLPTGLEAITASQGEGTLETRLSDSALRSLLDGLVLLDASARVVFCNPRAEELLRCPAHEMLGRHADEMIDRVATHSTAAGSVRARMCAALHETSEMVEMEITPAPNGAHTITAQSFPLNDAQGSRLGTGLLLRDVTRARAADASKSQLLSTVSHELRTPLASIKGFATTLLRQDVRWDEATQRDFLHIIEEEADRLTEIIDNLLDMSQIEAGALRIRKEPAQMRQLIREVVDEMRMRTEAHWFLVDLPTELPRVLIDTRRIRQVLHNLIGNAIKYSKGGQITISCEVEGEHVVASVSDQGEGIPTQYLDKIFERFFQVDGALTRRVGGSGLGLSISRSIIEAHGGRIWAESVVGQGSTFRFTLPVVYDEVVSK